MNARRTPRRVLRRHTPDQATGFGFRRGASDEPATRLPGPELPKAFPVPAHDRVGLNDDPGLFPPWPKAAQREPEEPIHRPHSRARSLGREDGELLAEGEVFDQKVGSRRCETSEPTKDEGDSGEHRDRMEGCRGGVNSATGLDSRFDPARASRSLSTRMGSWRATGGGTGWRTRERRARGPRRGPASIARIGAAFPSSRRFPSINISPPSLEAVGRFRRPMRRRPGVCDVLRRGRALTQPCAAPSLTLP